LSTKDTPDGRLPTSLNAGVGAPTDETVNASGEFSAKLADAELVMAGGSVEVSVKTFDGPGALVEAAVAVTTIAPGFRFAVNSGAAATPAAVVVTTADEPPPANVPLGPLAGAWKVTLSPPTGLFNESVTVTFNGRVNGEPMIWLWLLVAVETTTTEAGPALLVSGMETLTEPTAAVTE